MSNLSLPKAKNPIPTFLTKHTRNSLSERSSNLLLVPVKVEVIPYREQQMYSEKPALESQRILAARP